MHLQSLGRMLNSNRDHLHAMVWSDDRRDRRGSLEESGPDGDVVALSYERRVLACGEWEVLEHLDAVDER